MTNHVGLLYPKRLIIRVHFNVEIKKRNTHHPTSVSRRYYLPTPPLGQDMTQGQFLSGV